MDKKIIEEVLKRFDKEKIEASMRETPNCYGLCFTYGEVEENILPYALELKEQEIDKMIYSFKEQIARQENDTSSVSWKQDWIDCMNEFHKKIMKAREKK